MIKVVKISTILLAMSICFSACRKDENMDSKIIEPLEYFPAYPGSFWVYDTGDTIKVSNSYESSGAVEYSNDGVKIILLFPKLFGNEIFNSTDTYINGYKFNPPRSQFLSIEEGNAYAISSYSQGHQRFRKTIKVDTSITIENTIYNNVIVVAEYESACGYGESCYELKDYFAKDVGLVKSEYKNFQDSLYYSTFELESYFINY